MSRGSHIVQVRTKLTLEVVPHACGAIILFSPYFNVAGAIFLVIAQLQNQITPFNIETGDGRGLHKVHGKSVAARHDGKKAKVSFVQGGWPNHYM